ncbi:ABC transporter substrate-binding protein [Halalkalicoccus jeotgali]|uniref:ABC-type nitrate/sulfonate/bicarbonate transport systems periplasmic component-like protein n=1 Tax=Halalkalicoccus jeotgali (strain DSM 18796 / CECT 7217 / JCM 14584 / KCTC 4019 / B3) TaxID=795797 RepID=D8J3T8_HALJB|nr:ABC transporter substrate-binding protein [Halalkalicoccus jeotgali]ADJ13429.1 ABC-type nitrate/sulfonate/bicarbonate transport systems periplasmic component-like protein [Halalkalicoccus jeotgali B3]ELY32739.1 nitrate/sulfonate/bicarbonate ABC transporter periplasmic component-like protein [Halalkalicoccus jeotgali B3]
MDTDTRELRRQTGESADKTGVSRRRLLQASGVLGASALAGCTETGVLGGTAAAFDEKSFIVGYQPFYTESWSALVIRHAGLAEKHLPEEYSVGSWEVALQGAVIGNKMISTQNDIGYTGDMPSITALANEETKIDLVAMAGFSKGQQCNLCFVPSGSSVSEPADLDGREVGVTTGSCTHRFILEVMDQEGIQPDLSDQGMATISTNVREGNIPVGVGWEPAVARSVIQQDAAEYAFTGASYDLYDAAGLLMLDSLVEDHPEAAKGWLKAELEAKHIMATDPERTMDLITQEGQLRGYDRETLRATLYENLDVGSGAQRLLFYTDYEAIDTANRLFKERAPEFLYENQGVIPRLPPEERYRVDLLREAIEELRAEADWNPLREAER